MAFDWQPRTKTMTSNRETTNIRLDSLVGRASVANSVVIGSSPAPVCFHCSNLNLNLAMLWETRPRPLVETIASVFPWFLALVTYPIKFPVGFPNGRAFYKMVALPRGNSSAADNKYQLLKIT